MKNILLQIFTVFALTSIVAKDVYKCLNFPLGMEVYVCDEEGKDAKKESKIEDDTQGKTFNEKESEFFLSLTTIKAAHHTGIPESYCKLFHPSASLSIFSPPPNRS